MRLVCVCTIRTYALDFLERCSCDFCSATRVMLSKTYSLLCVLCYALAEKPTDVVPPNIIIMLMDDVSYFPVVFLCFLLEYRSSVFQPQMQWRVNELGSAASVAWLCGHGLCSTDGLGGPGGLWPGVQGDPQPGRNGCSGNALSQLLHCQPSVFPM